MGGGIESITPFLFVKTIEKVIRLCTVLICYLISSFEDMGIFHVFLRLPSVHMSTQVYDACPWESMLSLSVRADAVNYIHR